MKRPLSSMLVLLAIVCAALIVPANKAGAASINSVWFNWSNNNNGSIVVNFQMHCQVQHWITSAETYPTNQFLGQWTWGPTYGATESYYAIINIKPDLTNYSRMEGDVVVACSDVFGDYYYFQGFHITVTRNPSNANSPYFSWYRTQ